MDISDYMHPLFKRGKTKKTDSIMNATIDSLNKPLTDAETRILNSKTNVLLEKAPKEWLDYFGSYLGLHRKENETDEDYRKRLMSWVLVNKNDANSIRNAIANFLEISADRIFVYEPYEDIFFYNHAKSLWNSFSFRPSTYYNYAVIDIKIDANFPYKEVADIINLFRPAGVIWVITASINSYNPDAPIIDNTLDGSNSMEFVDTEYTGFNTHDSIVITPELNDDLIVTNPFYWNVSDSLWNGGKEYGNSHSAFQDYLVFGEYDTEFIPSNGGFSDLRKFVHNYDKVSNHLMSVKDDKGISFNLNTYDTSNSLSISNSELTSDKERNLLLDTISKQSSSWFTKGELDNGKYLGSFINKTNHAWQNARYNFQDLVSRGVINTTDTYVYSAYIKVDSSTELSLQDFTFYGLNCSSHGKHPYAAYDDIDLTTWTQIYVPLKFNNLDNPNDFSDYQLALRFECDKSTPNGYVYFACPKLEKGTKATDYSIAPEDIDNNLPNPICDGVLQSDGTLGIHANTSYSHTFDNGDYITFDMMSVADSKVTINNNLYAIDTTWKRVTIPLDNHILIVSPLNNTFIKNVSISETLPSTSSDNSFYPYNEIRDKIKGVAGILDIKHTLVALSSRYTTGKSVAEIANSYADKYLSMVLSTDTFGNNSKCALELFDYSCGLWVQYKEFSLSDKVQQLNIKIDDVTNYLNENGLLCFRIRTLDTDTITTIVVDYVGFSFYDTIYNNPRINWYYNAYRLITKTNFEDNQLGSWIGGTLVTSDNPIGTVYHNYLSSDKGGSLIGCPPNVVRGWIQSDGSWASPQSTHDNGYKMLSINGGDTLTFTVGQVPDIRRNEIAFYDTNRSLVQYKLNNNFGTSHSITLTAPSNAKYVSFSFYTGEGKASPNFPIYIYKVSSTTNSVLTFNESFNVVPTTTYYLDIWYKATSETTIKLGDTVLDTLPSATDWEHISKDIQIPDRLLSGNISLSSSRGEIDIAYISIKIDEGNDL